MQNTNANDKIIHQQLLINIPPKPKISAGTLILQNFSGNPEHASLKLNNKLSVITNHAEITLRSSMSKSSVLSISPWFFNTKSRALSPEKVVGLGPALLKSLPG